MFSHISFSVNLVPVKGGGVAYSTTNRTHSNIHSTAISTHSHLSQFRPDDRPLYVMIIIVAGASFKRHPEELHIVKKILPPAVFEN